MAGQGFGYSGHGPPPEEEGRARPADREGRRFVQVPLLPQGGERNASCEGLWFAGPQEAAGALSVGEGGDPFFLTPGPLEWLE